MKPAQVLSIKEDKNNCNRFYVYYHTDSEGNIFYIGKGRNKRAYETRSRNPDWHSYVNSLQEYGVCFFAMGLTDEQSRDLEKELIKEGFKEGLPLVNKTLGGQGTSRKVSPEKLYKWRVKHGRRVYCYQTGKVYLCATDASEQLGVGSSHVAYCCNKKSIQAKGYNFDWLDNVDPKDIGKLRPMAKNIKAGRSIVCEQTGKVYTSIYKLVRDLNIEASHVDRHLKGKLRHASGYTFKDYVDGMEIEIKPMLDRRPKIKCLTNGITYDSISQCSRELNIDGRMVVDVCEGRRSQSKKLKFEYVRS